MHMRNKLAAAAAVLILIAATAGCRNSLGLNPADSGTSQSGIENIGVVTITGRSTPQHQLVAATGEEYACDVTFAPVRSYQPSGTPGKLGAPRPLEGAMSKKVINDSFCDGTTGVTSGRPYLSFYDSPTKAFAEYGPYAGRGKTLLPEAGRSPTAYCYIGFVDSLGHHYQAGPLDQEYCDQWAPLVAPSRSTVRSP
jgi:hypothetical protein